MIQVYTQGLPTLLAKCLASGLTPNHFANPQFLHALGEIKTAQLEFLEYTVPDQAFSEQNPIMLSSPSPSLSPSCSASYPYIEHPSSAGHAGPWTQQWFENPHVPQ
jgi:hypothetical protein